jgi:predicted enzyme related to lactoylglutathione lyase
MGAVHRPPGDAGSTGFARRLEEVPMSMTEGVENGGGAGPANLKLEVILLPVSDVDRAAAFYRGLGWRVDADVTVDGLHLLQFTPPGSQCSIQFGNDLTPAAPGSSRDVYLVVDDIEAARAHLVAQGVAVSDPFHEVALGGRFQDPGGKLRAEGASPESSSYGSFATFSDPDGNSWLLQEITTRLPGRIDSASTSYVSVRDLADAMRRASEAHGEHEKRIGRADPDWPDWYAAYMVAEQAGAELPK